MIYGYFTPFITGFRGPTLYDPPQLVKRPSVSKTHPQIDLPFEAALPHVRPTETGRNPWSIPYTNGAFYGILMDQFLENPYEKQWNTRLNVSMNISWFKLHNFLPWSITAKALSTISFVVTLQICRPKQICRTSLLGPLGVGARLELKIPLPRQFREKKTHTYHTLDLRRLFWCLEKKHPQNYSIPPANGGCCKWWWIRKNHLKQIKS